MLRLLGKRLCDPNPQSFKIVFFLHLVQPLASGSRLCILKESTYNAQVGANSCVSARSQSIKFCFYSITKNKVRTEFFHKAFQSLKKGMKYHSHQLKSSQQSFLK